MESTIKKITEENFHILADNEESMIYAKAMIKRGDYVFRIGVSRVITGDGYRIERERKEDLFIDDIPNAL